MLTPVDENTIRWQSINREIEGEIQPNIPEGMVDEKTQRAAWRAADGTNENLVMETGIYNLTEDEVSVLVHFGPETNQTWTMVRVEAPEESEEQ